MRYATSTLSPPHSNWFYRPRYPTATFSGTCIRTNKTSPSPLPNLIFPALFYSRRMRTKTVRPLSRKFTTRIIIITTVIAMLQQFCQAKPNINPLILVPGSGGNQLEAKLTAEYRPSSLLCKIWHNSAANDDLDIIYRNRSSSATVVRKDNEWYRIWFDPHVLLAPFTKCFSERMMLHYDPVSDDYYNTPGVETRVSGFGSTKALRYLDPKLKKLTAYMAPLIESLEQVGYADGETLFGAPYDFRYGLAPKGLPCRVGSKYLEDLKHLIEEASISNEGKPVVILSHSLGGLFVLQLLLRNPLSWRQRYIKHFIALSAPWGGTVQEMLTFASGYTLGVPLVEPLLVREEQRSSDSNLWLMPRPKTFGRSKPLVITPNATYRAYDIALFLNDIGFQHGVEPYKTRILPMVDEEFMAPLVPITCIIGVGVQTPETLFYRMNGFDEQPHIVYGDGDGTVNLMSLLALESEWANNSKQSLEVIKFKGISHAQVLSDSRTLDLIVRLIDDINSLTQQKYSFVDF